MKDHLPPNPISHPEIDDVDTAPDVRRLHCRMYTHCLIQAANKNWPGFSCNKCMAFVPLTKEEERADMEAFARLLGASHTNLRRSGLPF